MKLTIETIDQGNSYAFHVDFLSAEDEQYEYKMTCGAGCGNDRISFMIRDKSTGNTIREYVSMKDVFSQWIDNSVKRLQNQIK